MTLHVWDEALPVVTTIITSYNYARFLPQAIESALEQDYSNHEVLILDNCSTDDSREIIERYTQDKRVRAIFNEVNLGLIGNYNLGIQKARGTYIVLLSADDRFFAGHLRRSIEYYRSNPDIDLLYTPYYIIDAEGAVIERSTAYGIPHVESYSDRNEFADVLQYDNYMYLPSMLVHRSLYEKYGGFLTEVPVAADYEICLRWVAAGKRFGFLNAPAVAMRRHGSNRSGDAYVETGAQLREHVWILDKYITEENSRFYTGRESDIVSMLQAKINNLAPHAEVFEPAVAELQPRIHQIIERLRQTQTLRPPSALFSVVVPFRGDVRALRDALSSIAAQTYENWEAVIVQDGGPSIESLLGSLTGSDRFRYVRRVLRGGAAAARNDGIRLARGEVIAYLDEDNLWLPEHLAILTGALNQAKTDVAVTQATSTIEQMEPQGHRAVLSRDELVYALGSDSWPVHTANAVPLNCVAHRRACISTSGFFSDLRVLEDFEFLLRLSNAFPAAIVCSKTVDVRSRSSFAGQSLNENWAALPALAASLFGRYGVEANSEIAHRRETYLKDLHGLAAQGPSTPLETAAAITVLAGAAERK